MLYTLIEVISLTTPTIIARNERTDKNMREHLNERIHDLRDRSGMTQTQLALRMGVTRSCVNAWEMGISKPSLDNLVTLSRIFHTTTDYLLGNDQLETIVINDFTISEKELLMHVLHFIEQNRNHDNEQ